MIAQHNILNAQEDTPKHELERLMEATVELSFQQAILEKNLKVAYAHDNKNEVKKILEEMENSRKKMEEMMTLKNELHRKIQMNKEREKELASKNETKNRDSTPKSLEPIRSGGGAGQRTKNQRLLKTDAIIFGRQSSIYMKLK